MTAYLKELSLGLLAIAVALFYARHKSLMAVVKRADRFAWKYKCKCKKAMALQLSRHAENKLRRVSR